MMFDQFVTFLPIRDLARSVAFYEGILGLELVLNQGDCRIYRVAGDAFIGICLRPADGPSDGVMLTLVTDEVDEWHKRLESADVHCDRSPARNDAYDLYHAFYRDPDGHVLEVQSFLDPDWPGALASAPKSDHN